MINHADYRQWMLPDGRRVGYIDSGQGKTMLLLHGFCGSWAYWQHMLPLIAPSYRVIAPDLRGHGQSDSGSEPFAIDDMADDVAHLLAALSIDSAIVFGHSLGGYTALALAERHPTLVGGLALVHSTAYPDSDEAKANRLRGIEAIHADGIGPYVDGLIPKLFAPANVTAKAELVREAVEIGYHTSPEGAMRTLAAMRERPDRNAVLEQPDRPVLLVAGTEDQVIPPERTFSRNAPHIRTATIPGAGHMSMVETPTLLTAHMLDFTAHCHNAN